MVSRSIRTKPMFSESAQYGSKGQRLRSTFWMWLESTLNLLIKLNYLVFHSIIDLIMDLMSRMCAQILSTISEPSNIYDARSTQNVPTRSLSPSSIRVSIIAIPLSGAHPRVTSSLCNEFKTLLQGSLSVQDCAIRLPLISSHSTGCLSNIESSSKFPHWFTRQSGCMNHPISRNFYPAGAAHAIFVQLAWICSTYHEHEQRPVTVHSAVPRLQSGTIFRNSLSRQTLLTLFAID